MFLVNVIIETHQYSQHSDPQNHIIDVRAEAERLKISGLNISAAGNNSMALNMGHQNFFFFLNK